MKTKDLKINFRYLGGNIACLSVDSIDGESVHNDINNEEAIIIFNSIVGEKENCQTVKTLLKENQELKEKLDKYENPEDMTLMMMWCTEKVKDENEKLKEEITNLSKDVDMWNAKYNDMFDENKRLKEALEAKSYCKYADKCDELDDCSREEYEDMSNTNVRLTVENYDLKEENQELKKHLKVPKTCNLKTLEDYKSYYEDTTREQILEDTYIEYCAYVNLAHRYSELKEQLENCYCNRTDCSGRIKDSKVYDSLVQKVKTQQKEFINWLEDMLDDENDIFSVVRVKDVLQKYKEIIGVLDENTIK